MTNRLKALFEKLAGTQTQPEPEPPAEPAPPQRRGMFSGGMTGDRPAEKPSTKPTNENEPWRITREFLEILIRKSASPIVTADELAALRQADTEAIELERIEAELCRDLYGSATTPSAYQRQFTSAEEVAAGEKPADLLKTVQTKSREELALALSIKKSGVHSAIIAVSQVPVRIAGEIVPRLKAEAARLAGEIEDEDMAKHADWQIAYVPSGIVAGLRQVEQSIHRWIPTSGVPLGRLDKSPLIGAVLAASKPDGKGKSK